MKSKKTAWSENQNILTEIEKIALDAKGSGFSEEFLYQVCCEAESVAAMIDCNEIQAVLFSLVFNLNFTNNSVDIDCLSKYLDCTPIMVARYINDLEGLCKMKILRYENSPSRQRRQRENSLDRVAYYVNRKVLDALLNNQIYVPESDEASDNYDLMSKIIGSMNDRDKGQLTWEEMAEEVRAILDENYRLPFVMELNRFNLQINELLILFWVCDEFLDGREASDFSDVIKSIFPDFRTQLEIRKEFLDGSNDLIQKGLVTLEDGYFRSDRNIILTERTLDILLGNDKAAFLKKSEKKASDVIFAREIESKRLYFNENEERQLTFLTKSLMPANYKKLVRRLRQEGMKAGFCALFHGIPGVGKTESVFQIAKHTGRDIKMVTISETKSMWFGQSEKLIKNIFDQYRRQVEKSAITPILLFNEADGILSSRKQIGSSPVDQTENAIQNILLQEMENLEGIMIATTNLTQNLDKAFERRFLYKILFNKPGSMNRINIWKDRVRGLTMVQRNEISSLYDFTGGQIDNISRKLMIHEILNGSPDYNLLKQFCEEERLEETRYTKIGFLM
jgi:hypothetical protein